MNARSREHRRTADAARRLAGHGMRGEGVQIDQSGQGRHGGLSPADAHEKAVGQHPELDDRAEHLHGVAGVDRSRGDQGGGGIAKWNLLRAEHDARLAVALHLRHRAARGESQE